MTKVTDSIYLVGVNDHDIDLFEGQYVVPNGMSYNSYLIKDEKIAVLDTVDARFDHEWLDNIQDVIGSKNPDYLIVQHMEPDHSANIEKFMHAFPEATVVANAKTMDMISAFFPDLQIKNTLVVNEYDTLSLGSHTLTFVFAPMVHWPEVMVTYDSKDKVLFSADGFGKFGALDVEEDWLCEARRYYFGIVGKYGKQVQALLKKASGLDIELICPLHGPVLKENLGYYLNIYDIWSSYQAEDDGVMVAYTSVYGNTAKAARLIAEKLKNKNCPKVTLVDLAREDMAEAIEDAFRYSKLVLATTTYNAGIFPFMKQFIDGLVERNYRNRTVAFVENGSWSPLAAKIMKQMLENCPDITYAEHSVRIKSSVNKDTIAQIEDLTDELCAQYIAQVGENINKNDPDTLYKISYGLYLVTSKDSSKDNGLIVNTVTQLSDSPNKIGVTINKANYSHHVIKQTGKMNVNILTTETPFSLFEQFGFSSGRNKDKFENTDVFRSENGLVFLARYINGFISLVVDDYVDLGSHGMFICSVTESRTIDSKETMTYSYYHDKVKPKPDTEGKKGFVCKICGYIHEGDVLPDDFVCPLCKHGAADFEPIQN